MLTDVPKILLLLSLYFSDSQSVFANDIIAAEPQEKKVIQDYLRDRPINHMQIKQLEKQAQTQLNQLSGLSKEDVSQLLKQREVNLHENQ